MTSEHGIREALTIGDGQYWEFKSAKAGIPGDLWETYSGVSNTEGGTIVLGIRETAPGHDTTGWMNPEKRERNSGTA